MRASVVRKSDGQIRLRKVLTDAHVEAKRARGKVSDEARVVADVEDGNEQDEAGSAGAARRELEHKKKKRHGQHQLTPR